MKTITTAAAGVALAGSLIAIAPPAPAAPTPDNYLVKAVVRATWNNMSPAQRRAICTGFWVNPSRMVNIIARPSIRSGSVPSWQIKPIIRRFLVRAC